MRAAFSEAVNRIHDFIITNNLTPITKAELEAELLRSKKGVLASRPAEELEAACKETSEPGSAFRMLKARGPEWLRASIDNLLSVPRPPVMAPCL